MTGNATLRGSQGWLQLAVNRCPDIIDDAISEAMGLGQYETIEWLSPLESEDFIEYRDCAFLERFPTSGPQEDRYGTAWLEPVPDDLSL